MGIKLPELAEKIFLAKRENTCSAKKKQTSRGDGRNAEINCMLRKNVCRFF